MPFARISSKLPSNYPSFCPTVSVTDTSSHSVSSLSSGPSSPALLTVPVSGADVDGKRFTIYWAGRIKLYSGATPGNFLPIISQGNPASQNILTPTIALPASASGVLVPFSLRVQLSYDAQAQVLGRIYDFLAGVVGTSSVNSPTAGSPFSVDPNSLIFQAKYSFSVAPLSGTTVEVIELALG